MSKGSDALRRAEQIQGQNKRREESKWRLIKTAVDHGVVIKVSAKGPLGERRYSFQVGEMHRGKFSPHLSTMAMGHAIVMMKAVSIRALMGEYDGTG